MTTREAALRILVALYGKDMLYRAPETFEFGHRALWMLATGNQRLLGTLVDDVEAARAAHDAKVDA